MKWTAGTPGVSKQKQAYNLYGSKLVNQIVQVALDSLKESILKHVCS